MIKIGGVAPKNFWLPILEDLLPSVNTTLDEMILNLNFFTLPFQPARYCWNLVAFKNYVYNSCLKKSCADFI